MLIPTLTAIPLVLAGILVLGVAHRARTGRLPKNHWIGVRNERTLRSSEAWKVGHRAAAAKISIGGIGLVAAAVVAALQSADLAPVPAFIGCVWLVAWFIAATADANRAVDALA